MFFNKTVRRWFNYSITYVAIGVISGSLVACGGGSSSGGCATLDPTRSTSLPGCTSTSTSGSTTSTGAVTLALDNASGAATTSIAVDAPGTLVATVTGPSGAAVANTAVSFTTTDKTGSFVPASASALTDANGVARIGLPAGTQSGGYTVTASATIGLNTVTGSASYAVIFPVITLSAPVIAPTTLAAGGTASLTVTVLNGTSAFTPAQSIAFSSPCVTAGKAKISSPVVTVNGVATTSYTDMGCGSADLITASTVYNGATVSSSATLTVQAASAGQLAFVSALPQNIALKGTGGAGRQESSTITFKVLDSNGNAVSGQTVNFSLNTSAGGLTLNPASATTGADGTVTTTVAAGTVNTPVRVTATLPGSGISSLSDQLVVSTGVADQNSFTLSTATFNVEGFSQSGCAAPNGSVITARLADHFHNPVPDGTAVSFTAEGGSIDASCLTGLDSSTLTDGTVITQKGTPGQCTVRFCSGNPRPANGRVSVLAYALGEESFTDVNGNNLYDVGEPFTDLGEPFRDDPETGVYAAGEPYIDTNGNGKYDVNGDGLYNGVLQAVPNGTGANTVHVRQSLVQILSGSSAAVTQLTGSLALSHCVDNTVFNNVTQTLSFAIRDQNPTIAAGNTVAGVILPAGTTIAFSSSNGAILGSTSFTVQNANSASASAWTYSIQMISDATQSVAGGVCTNSVTSGQLTVTVTTPSGAVTQKNFTVTD